MTLVGEGWLDRIINDNQSFSAQKLAGSINVNHRCVSTKLEIAQIDTANRRYASWKQIFQKLPCIAKKVFILQMIKKIFSKTPVEQVVACTW